MSESQQVSKASKFGIYIRGRIMELSEFTLPNTGQVLYTAWVAIPGNTQNLGVSITGARYHELEIDTLYDKKVTFMESRKNNRTYFTEVEE